MYFTVQSKTSTGVLTVKQIIFTLVLLIVLVGQASSIPFRAPRKHPTDHAGFTGYQ